MHRNRIALVDDYPIVLAGLAELIRRGDRHDVIGTGASAEEALLLAREDRPDLIVMDLQMPGNVLDAVQEITSGGQGTRVLVFSGSECPVDCRAALKSGAMGYVVKGCSGAELSHAIDSVLLDRQFVSSDLAIRLLSHIAEPSRREKPAITFTHREEQILRHLMRGASNREIAKSLTLSEKTVKYYMTPIMQKLNARNRLEVVVKYGAIAPARAKPSQAN